MVPRFAEIQLFQILGFINIPLWYLDLMKSNFSIEGIPSENHFLNFGITMIAWVSSIQWDHMSPKNPIFSESRYLHSLKSTTFCENSSFYRRYISQNSDFHRCISWKTAKLHDLYRSNSSKSPICLDFNEHSKNRGTFICQTLMFTQGIYLNFLDSESTASQSSYLIWTSSSYVGDDQVGSIKFIA